MNVISKIRALLKPTKVEPTEEYKRWLQGYHAYNKAEQHLRVNELLEGLANFDRAIFCGFGQKPEEGGEVFSGRGVCLQGLGFDLEAIDDFSKAIQLRHEYNLLSREGEDCNLYFMRANSKNAVGDFDGSIADMEEAIEIAKSDSSLNPNYDAGVQATGWRSMVHFLEFQLTSIQETRRDKEHFASTFKLLFDAGKITLEEYGELSTRWKNLQKRSHHYVTKCE